MKRHRVVFSARATADLIASLEWGGAAWGDQEARKWYSGIRVKIRSILGSFPKGQPLALDNDEYEVEVRQLSIGRYRVLFNVTGSIVTILHVQGPYTGK
jgi:plasmid stabilization system protein ParE